MSDGHCFGCDTLLLEIDKDPNGAENSTCKRCLAEEDHDFDRDPGAVFSRSGERTDPQPEWTPPARAFKNSEDRPARRYVTIEQLEAWAAVLESAHEKVGGRCARQAATEIRAVISGAPTKGKG